MRIALVLLAGSILLTGCGTQDSTGSSEAAPSESVTASVGLTTIHSVDLPQFVPLPADLASGAAKRIVTLAVGSGEIVAALGAGDRVVGRDETSSAPQIDGAPIVTKAHNVSAELVIGLKPDVVLVDDLTSPPEAIDQMRAAGIRVVSIPQAWAMADMRARILKVASAIGARNGQALADRLTAPVTAQSSSSSSSASSSSSSSPGKLRVAFLYLRGTSAIYLIGGKGSGADDLISRAGGIDVGAAAGLAPFTPLTAEALATLNPDVILVMTKGLESVGGIAGLTKLPGVAQTNAGRDGRAIAVDDTVLLSFGPRTAALVQLMAQALK